MRAHQRPSAEIVSSAMLRRRRVKRTTATVSVEATALHCVTEI